MESLGAGIGSGLYASQPTFRAKLDDCDALVGKQLGRPLKEILFGNHRN